MKYFLLLLVMCLTCLLEAHAEEYAYVSYAVDDSYYSGKDTYTIDTHRGVAYADHGVERIKLCQDSAKLNCFVSGSIVFAVPKKGISTGETWGTEGQIFTVERSEQLHLLGQKMNVFVVSTKRDETRRDYFYYSNRDGLVGIKIVDRNKSKPYVRFLLLTNRKGFPK